MIVSNNKKFNLKTNIQHCVISFIMAWCCVCFVQIIVTSKEVSNPIGSLLSVSYSLNTLIFVGIVFIVTAAFLMLLIMTDSKIIEAALVFITTFPYAVVCAAFQKEIIFCLFLVILMLFELSYVFRCIAASEKDIGHYFNKKLAIMVIVILAAAFVLFTGGFTVYRYLTYSVPNFDGGLFSQMFYYMKNHFTMETTCERDMLVSHMKIHTSPVYWLLLPFYLLYPGTAILQVLQAIVIALGVIPLVLIGKNHHMKPIQLTLLSAVYFFYPVMSAGCSYDIHENMFLPVAILCLILAFEKDSLWGIIISTIFVLSIKEDAAVYAAFIAIYMIFSRKMYKKGIIVLMVSVVYFFGAVYYINHFGMGTSSDRFNNVIASGDGNVLGIIKTVLVNPAYVFGQMFCEEKLNYIIAVMAPLLFLPIWPGKWQKVILLGPLFLFNLMPDYEYFSNIGFQYTFGSATLLLYSAFVTMEDINKSPRTKLLAMMAVSSVLFFMSTMWGKLYYMRTYNKEYNQVIYQKMDEALALIPDDASVTASTFLCAKLSSRDVLHEIYYTDKIDEYIALDLRGMPQDYDVNDYLNNEAFETIYYDEVCIAVFRRKN